MPRWALAGEEKPPIHEVGAKEQAMMPIAVHGCRSPADAVIAVTGMVWPAPRAYDRGVWNVSADPGRTRRWLLSLIVLWGMAVRIAFALSTPQSPPISDMAEYWDRAIQLYEHGALLDSWRMPGLPAALCGVFLLSGGPSVLAARALNVAASVITIVATYLLARRIASVRASLAAAFLVASYPSLIVYTSLVATESVVTAPLMAALLAAAVPSSGRSALAGALAAVTTLIRPAAIAIVPAIAVPGLPDGSSSHWMRAARHSLVAASATVTLLAPWWVHNYRMYGRFVPLDHTGGINLAIGNGPEATGRWHFANVVKLQSRYLPGVDVTTADGASAAARVALRNLEQDPWLVLRLLPAKLSGLFAIEGREHAFLYSIGYFGAHRGGVVHAWGLGILLSFPILLSLAMLGICVRGTLTSRVSISCVVFIAATVVATAASFGDPRFHLPLVPVLAVLATGVERWRAGVDWRRAVPAALCLAALLAAWAPQVANYRAALAVLVAPGGESAGLSFDDLLR